MSENTWQDRLWYLTWYIVIPAVLASALVFGLSAMRVIEAPDPWRWLLAFAVAGAPRRAARTGRRIRCSARVAPA